MKVVNKGDGGDRARMTSLSYTVHKFTMCIPYACAHIFPRASNGLPEVTPPGSSQGLQVTTDIVYIYTFIQIYISISISISILIKTYCFLGESHSEAPRNFKTSQGHKFQEFALCETNSFSPLKIGRKPIGKFISPTSKTSSVSL